METRHWNISIVENDEIFEAVITNMETGESLPPIRIVKDDCLDRDDAIGELFSGPLSNIRDSFDTI